ncbi:MAG: 50S ribosomal protein L31 [Lentisphaeria bacterium]|nr:50S ribosomal protein L31 [Lentisphaeria bacterium]
MQKEIHPTYFGDSVISCACGTEYKVGSTLESAKVSICASCHPFFTGQKKMVDTEGRVDRFMRRYQMADKG